MRLALGNLPPMSVSSGLIEAVIEGHLAPMLGDGGFKKSRRNWYQTNERSIAVVNVQASRHNTAEQTVFTVNLGVWFPEISGFLADFQPNDRRRPDVAYCHIGRRIGGLLPGGLDTWWELGSTADIESVGVAAAEALTTYGLPWLRDRSEPLDAFNAQRSERWSSVSPIVDCGLALIANRPELASLAFQEWSATSGSDNPKWAATVIEWAQQHNLG